MALDDPPRFGSEPEFPPPRLKRAGSTFPQPTTKLC